MITNYNKFRNERLNEGLWDSLKNLFGKLLQGVSEEIKKSVDELNNKLSKTKDPKQMEIIMVNYLKVHNTTLTNQLKNATNLPELRVTVKDNITAIYAAITAASKTLGKESFTFSEIFSDSPAGMKKLFDANEKNFNKNIDSFIDDLIITQAAQFSSYKDKQSTKVKLTETTEQAVENKNKSEKEAAEGNTPTTNAGGVQQESINIEENNRLNEEVEPVDPKVESADFQKLKDSMKKWFDFAIYKKVNDTLKESKTIKPTGTLEDKVKNMTTTKNTNSINKMIDVITKLDMDKLKQVRDILGLDKNTAPL